MANTSIKRAFNLSLAVFAVISICPTLAGQDEYGPFEEGKVPPRISLTRCNYKEFPAPDENRRPPIECYPSRKTKGPIRMRLENDENSNTIATLLDSEDKSLLGPQIVSDFDAYVGAYYCDLNGDQVTDFVAEVSSMGCGLGGLNCHVVLILSGQSGYRATTIRTTAANVRDCFVSLDPDHVCGVVQTTMIWAQGVDKKPHIFWVHHMLEVRNDGLKISTRDRQFPKWVWYTFKPNHRETTLLTATEKIQFWDRMGGENQIFWRPGLDSNSSAGG